MGRIKKDHTGYKTIGIWKKYQQPSIDDGTSKRKAKKDTKKWCKGKVGVKHDFKLVEERILLKKYIFKTTRCVNCNKKETNLS